MHGEFKSRRAMRRAQKKNIAKNQGQRPALVFAEVLVAMLATSGAAQASQLSLSAFTAYNAAEASSIVPGPLALYSVAVDSLAPTQMNEGFTEVDAKTAGFNILTPSELTADLLGDIEPVVIGPGGKLYLTDGHHTFTALEDSIYGASNPTVFVNVIANYSNLTEAQFFAQMQSVNLLLPLNDNVPQTVNDATGSPIPTTLTGLTSDVYRGLEYSILKNKNSKLFTSTANITGAVGSAKPGLDKMTGFYSDFLEAAAYQNAKGGLGLPYLSPGDVAISTQWNLNPNSTTTLPNVTGTVDAAQLPGFILSQNIVNSGGISNATLANGAMDGFGTFTGITEINAGTQANPIMIGTPNVGFIMELGNDLGFTVTLNGTNTYTGGTSILAGKLIIAGDSSLGAAGGTTAIDPANVLASVQADNGIIFNSLTEGNGTLVIGTTPGLGTATFTTDRPIAVGSEAATIDLNGYKVTLTGPLASLGTNDVGIGNATGYSDLTIDDNGSSDGILYLSTASPDFWGNLIIGNTNAPTVNVTSDLAMGNTAAYNTANDLNNPIGEIELNGGTLQTGASFTATDRNVFLGGGSNFDVDGQTTSWGTLTDVQRTLLVENSSTTSAGAVSFSSLAIGSTATLTVDAGTGSSGGKGTVVTFTNGITRNGNTDANAPDTATLIINPSTGSTLGSSAANGVEVFSSGASTTLTNGIVPVWIITDSGAGASSNPYNFLTYGANGYAIATYTQTGSGSGGGIAVAGSTDIVDQTGNATLAANASAYALKVNDGAVINATGYTITLGSGTGSTGLIMGGGSAAINGGTLAFGAAEAIIDVKSTSTISSAITGTGGLTLSGSGTLILSGTAGGLTGPIAINSGTLQLNTANYFDLGTTVWLSNVKSHPSNAILAIDSNQVISELNSDGTSDNNAVTIATGDTLTIGDTTTNLSSTLSTTLTASGTGSLVKAGSGLLDMSSSTMSFASGNVTVEGGQLRIGNGVFSSSATTAIILDAGTELQYAGNGGSVLSDPITGAGVFHLLTGTVQLTSTGNTYSGGTVLEIGTTLDVTTATIPNLSTSTITNAGGIVDFDQNANGTYNGVISNGLEMGTGPAEVGTLIKDDSSDIAIDPAGSNSNLTLAQAQTYTGATFVEAGTLTLGAVNTIATSMGVDLGRVGGAISTGTTPTVQTATLSLGANNTVQALTDELSNTTFVQLNGYTLTIDLASGADWGFAGTIQDSGTGNLTIEGAGAETLLGTGSVVNGVVTVSAGDLFVGGGLTSGTASVTAGALIVTGNMTTTGTTTVGGGLLVVGNALDSGAETLTGVAIPAAATTNTAVTGSMNVGALTETSGMVDVVTTLTSSGAITASGGTFLVSGTADTASAAFSGATAQITGTLAATGTVAITGGSVLDDGSITAASATLSAGALMVGDGGHTGASFGSSLAVSGSGMLSGYGTITGAVSNANIVAPGGLGNELLSLNSSLGVVQSSNGAPAGSIGTLSITGSYTQTSPGTLAIQLDATTGSQLAITGAATLGGTLAIMEDQAFYKRGTVYSVVTTTGGLDGTTFATLDNPEPWLQFKTVYTADNVDLLLTNFALPNSFGGVNLSPVVNALDNAPYGSAIDSITNVIGNDAASPQLQAQLLAQLANYSATAVQQAASETLQSIQGTLAGWSTIDAGTQPGPQSAAADPADGASAPLGPYTMRLQGFAQFDTLNGNANAPGVNSTIAGGVIGLDAPVDIATRIGAAFSYANSSVSTQNLPQSGTLDSYAASLYLGHRTPHLVYDAAVTLAYDTESTSRTIGVTNAAAKGNGDGYGAAVSGGVGYPITVFDLAVLEPRLGVEYDYNHQNGFTESDAGAADLQVQNSDFSTFRTSAGAKLSRPFDFADGSTLVPVLRAAWAHEWGDTSPTVDARFAATPSASFATVGANPGRDAALLGIGIDYTTSSSITLFARYDAAISAAETGQSIKAGLKISW